jgi:hypothetical protein
MRCMADEDDERLKGGGGSVGRVDIVSKNKLRVKHTCTQQRRWCSGINQDSHSCDPGSIPGRRSRGYSSGVEQSAAVR